LPVSPTDVCAMSHNRHPKITALAAS
jgi:hypothetical protein